MNENLKKEIEKLISHYKIEIERIKNNQDYKSDLKIQTVCVLREVTNDLENIVNANLKTRYKLHFIRL